MSVTTPYKLTDHDIIIGEGSSTYVLRVKDLPNDEKPREKLAQSGPGELSVAELVAVVWGVGSKAEDVLAMARRTVHEYGERSIANEHNPQRMADTVDIPLTKACQIVAAFELGRRFHATSAGRPIHIRNAQQAFQYLKNMGFLQKEQLRGLYLNSRHRVIHDEVISVGSLTSNVVHPREVFQPAVERGAVAIIIAHNHPSGSLRPTLADVHVTQQLQAAGEVLGIELLDHLIVAGDKYVSVADVSDQAT